MNTQKNKSVFIIILCLLLSIIGISQTTYYYISGNAQTAGNWNTNSDGSGSPASNFTTNNTIFNVPSGRTAGFTGNVTFGGAAALVKLEVIGSITIGNPRTLTIGAAGASVISEIIFYNTGATQASSNGNFTLTAGARLTTYNSAGIDNATNSSINSISGTVTLSTGADYQFAGATQTTNGLPATVRNLTIAASGTVTLAATVSVASGNLTISSGKLDLNSFTANRSAAGGTLTVASGAQLEIAGTNTLPSNYSAHSIGATSTIIYDGTNQTVANLNSSQTYGNLTLGGSGTKTLQVATTNITGNLTISGTATAVATVVGLTVGGNLALSGTAGFTAAGFALTVNGTTTVGDGTNAATLTTSSATGTKIFIGLVTVAATSTWNNSGNSNVTFRGGIINSGAFTAGSGVHTFDTNSQGLTGTLSIPSITVTGAAVDLTNNGTLTVSTALSGTGGLTNAASATLNIGGTSGITTITASATDNTVNFNGTGAQTIPGIDYYNLTLSGARSGANNITLANGGTIGVANTFTASATFGTGNYVTTSNTFSFNGSGAQNIPAFTFNNLSTATGGTKTLTGTVTVNTVLTVGSSSTLDLSSQTLNLAGSGTPLVVTGTFTPSTSTVNYTNAASTNVVAANYNNLNLTGGARVLASSGTIGIAGTFTTGSGGFTVTGSTVNFNGSGAQNIPAGITTYNNLSVSTSGTKTALASLTVNGALNIAAGVTLDMSTFQLISGGGSFSVSSSSSTAILKTSNTSTSALPTSILWPFEVQFVATGNQNIPVGTYSKLTTDGTGVKYIQGNVSVATLTLTAAAIRTTDNGNSPFTLSISSSIVRPVSGGQISAGTGTVNFTNSVSDLTIPQGTFSTAGAIIVSGGKKAILASDYGNSLSISSLTTTAAAGSFFAPNGNDLTLTGTVTMSSGNGLSSSHAGGTLKIGSGATNTTLGTLFFDQTTPGTTNSVYNVTINTTGGGSVFVGNTMRVRNTFQPPTSGTFVFNADSNLVIASRSTHTGRVGQIFNGFSFSGKVIVERFVKEKSARRYVFLASPVDGISIRNGWQDDIYITSPANGGTPCSTTIPANKYNDSGYDATTRKLVTIFKYNQAARQWDSVRTPSTTALLEKGIGYRVYYRGSRKADSTTCSGILESGTGGTPDSAIMNVYGTPTSGNVTVGVYGKGTNTSFGYTLLGNPYPCELDFETFAANNASSINATYWIHDPGASSTNGYLSYNNGSVAGGAGGVNTSGAITGANGRYLASGQGFMVQSGLAGNANAGTVTFLETQKSASQQLGVFRTANNLTWDSRIRVSFLNNDTSGIDDVLVRFSNDPTVTTLPSDFWDATSLNTTQYIGTIKSNRTFAIQTRPLNFYNDTVLVRIVSSTLGNYILKLSEFDNFIEADQIILLDLFTGAQQDVKANPFYAFTITSSSASQGGRFKIVFRSRASVLPVSFMNIAAIQKQDGAEVSWKVAFEQEIEHYQVERSNNSRDFNVIATVNSKGNSNNVVDYTYFDSKPINGTVYYRVKSKDKSGDSRYTAIVKLNSSKETMITVYPNPVKDNMKITIANAETFKRATVLIRNTQGKTVLQQNLTSTSGFYNLNVSALPSGIYVITVVNDKGDSLMEKFIKN